MVGVSMRLAAAVPVDSCGPVCARSSTGGARWGGSDGRSGCRRLRVARIALGRSSVRSRCLEVFDRFAIAWREVVANHGGLDPSCHFPFDVERCCAAAHPFRLLEREGLSHVGLVERPALLDDGGQPALELLHDGSVLEVLMDLGELRCAVRGRAATHALEDLLLLGCEVVREHASFDTAEQFLFLVEGCLATDFPAGLIHPHLAQDFLLVAFPEACEQAG